MIARSNACKKGTHGPTVTLPAFLATVSVAEVIDASDRHTLRCRRCEKGLRCRTADTLAEMLSGNAETAVA